MSIDNLIAQWAADRNLIEGSTPLKQAEKLYEEYFEFVDEARDGDITAAIVELGDILVVAEIIARQLGTTSEFCKQMAYSKIKDRRGKMVDGLWVKEAY